MQLHKKIIQSMRAFMSLFFDAGIKFSTDNCQRFAAALSYYTVFSLAPLLIIIVAVLGLYYEGDARIELVSRINDVAGEQVSHTINSLILAASQPFQTVFASMMAIATFLVGASRVIVELRAILNIIWGFTQKEEENTAPTPFKQVLHFLMVRVFSILKLIIIGFATLFLLIISTYFSTVNAWIAANTPEAVPVSSILDPLAAIVMTTFFFFIIMMALPAYRPPKRNVFLGALVSALLFNFGKTLFVMYLARTAATSIYGAASSIIVLMLWIYFSSCIFLYGAQLAATIRLKKLRKEAIVLEHARRRSIKKEGD